MLNFETYYLISIPGFIAGIITGRFFSGHHWQSIRSRIGSTGKFLGHLFYLGYLVSMPLILAILLIYLFNLRTAQPAKLAVTLLVSLWIATNLVLEIANLVNRRTQSNP